MASRGRASFGGRPERFWLYRSTKLLAGSGCGRGCHFSLYASRLPASVFWNWDAGKHRHPYCAAFGALAQCGGNWRVEPHPTPHSLRSGCKNRLSPSFGKLNPLAMLDHPIRYAQGPTIRADLALLGMERVLPAAVATTTFLIIANATKRSEASSTLECHASTGSHPIRFAQGSTVRILAATGNFRNGGPIRCAQSPHSLRSGVQNSDRSRCAQGSTDRMFATTDAFRNDEKF